MNNNSEPNIPSSTTQTKTTKMHQNEVDTSVELVRRLLASQFPQWAKLPIVPVASAGTDNAIYRLGDEMAVRLPRIDWAIGQVEKEHKWLPKLAPFLPLEVPVPLAKGEPDEGYPYQWSVQKWIEGENAGNAHMTDLSKAALDLAHFLKALRQIDTTGGPPAATENMRGMPLAHRDKATRMAIAALDDMNMINTEAAIAVWEAALHAEDSTQEPVWFHGDLLSGNLLVKQGQLHAVIDFGGLAVGDPTCDLMIAWSLFTGKSRDLFRDALDVDDATWLRGRGHSLSQAAIFIPYYLHTNPVGVRNAMHMIGQVIADYCNN